MHPRVFELRDRLLVDGNPLSGKGGPHAEASHVQTMLDCAEACEFAAHLMMRGSDLEGRGCALCTDACSICEASCRQLAKDPEMADCADVCRRCAEACRRMSQAA
jgi:hypothetical protein